MAKVKGATHEEIAKVNHTSHIKTKYDKDTNTNWIFTVKPGEHPNTNTIANKVVEANEHLNIIIQRDRPYKTVIEEKTDEGIVKTTKEKTTKETAVLKNLKELKKLLKENNYIYEIIPAQKPRYFFMDIDIDYYRKTSSGEKVDNLSADEWSYLQKNDIIEVLKKRIELLLEINIEDLVILQSLPTTDKLSYHLIFKDIILNNREESYALYKYIAQHLHDLPILSRFVDGSIYTRNRAMRLLNQSKFGKEATLQCISGHKKYNKLGLTCIYEEELEEDDFFDVDEFREECETETRDNLKKAKGDVELIKGKGHLNILHELNKDVSAEPNYDEEDDIRYLLTCIPNYPLQTYNIWLAIGFILKNQNCSVDYWIEWTNKGYRQYGEDKTNDVRNQWKSIGRVKDGGLTFGSLRKMANFYVPNPLEKRITKHITRNGEIDTTDLELNGIDREIYEADYVKDYDLDNHDVILERSPLGTGKTTAIKRVIENYNYKRILFFSPRIIFAKNVNEEFSNFYFHLYKDETGDLSYYDRLIISLESLNRIKEPKKYDLIVLDEMETILSGFSSPLIRDLKATAILYENIITNASKIIGMDAFLGERSIIYIRNMMEKRNVQNYISYSTNTVPGLLVRLNTIQLKEKHAVKLSKNLLKQKLFKCLNAGERIALFSGSKKFVNEEVKPLVKNMGLVEGEDALFYTADTDDKKKNDVKNIRKKWTNNSVQDDEGNTKVKDVKLLCYTPCITVGVNYDIADHYDSIFCYALPSCLVRDYFQGLYRVRETRKRKLYYTIQSFYTDRKPISKRAIADRFEKNNKKNKERYNQLIKQLDIEDDFEQPPRWLNDVHICNLSEKNLSDCHFETMFDYFLKINNYVKKKENLKDENLEFTKANTCLDWEEIDDLDNDKKQEVVHHVNINDATEVEKLQLRKYFINNYLKDTEEDYKKKIWNTIQQTENMKKFYRILYELNNNTKELIRNELKQKTYGAFVDSLTLSYPQIKELMNILGVKHSCDNQTLIEQGTLTDNEDRIKKLSKKVKDHLGIVDRRKNVTLKQNKTLQTELKNLVNDVITAWSGSSLKSKSTRQKAKGKTERVYTYYLQPMEGFEGLQKAEKLGNIKKSLNNE
jgi:hypothetical protein